jgi:SAM-dependent methyltransferase
MDWSDGYYGELYLESVAGLLTPALSALEAQAIGQLLALGSKDRLLDLACGQGRHAWPLAARVQLVLGVDRSRPYLRRAVSAAAPSPRPPRFACADLFALPFADGTFDAVVSWYASLFMYDEARNLAALTELARVLRPGGRAVVQHGNPLRLSASPRASARRALADGGVVEEGAYFDAASGVERAHRRLTRPDGSLLEGTAELRYYRPVEWEQLARRAGLRLLGVTSTEAVATGTQDAPGAEALDLVALLERG